MSIQPQTSKENQVIPSPDRRPRGNSADKNLDNSSNKKQNENNQNTKKKKKKNKK